MEPTNLNSPPPDDEQLEALLRRAASAALPDDGFSTRVLAALPSKDPSPSPLLRPTLCVVAAVAGTAFAWKQLTSTTDPSALSMQWERSMEEMRFALEPFQAAPVNQGLWIAVGVTVLSLLFAFRRSLHWE